MAKRPEARAAAGVPVVGARRVLKCEWALAVAEPPNVVGGQPLPPVVGALDWGSSGCVFGVRHNRHTRAARTRRENRRRRLHARHGRRGATPCQEQQATRSSASWLWLVTLRSCARDACLHGEEWCLCDAVEQSWLGYLAAPRLKRLGHAGLERVM
ncbi:unnamed protein product [Lampetra planeri]